jgi:hypothetical protein
MATDPFSLLPDPPSPEANRRSEAVILLVSILSVVVTIIAIPWPRWCLALAAGAIAVALWRRLIVKAPLRDSVQMLAVAIAVGLIATFFIASNGDEEGRSAAGSSNAPPESLSAPQPRHEASPGKVIQVFNRTTRGPRLRDDDELVWLTTKPVRDCRDKGCNIAGTERDTGGAYDSAVCQIKGQRVINHDTTTEADNRAPGRFGSSRWYGVRLPASRVFGYVSEVWIHPRDRSGLGLPTC